MAPDGGHDEVDEGHDRQRDPGAARELGGQDDDEPSKIGRASCRERV